MSPRTRRRTSPARRHQPRRYALRLYVTGTTGKSIRALHNLRRICEHHLAGRYSLEVVDVYKNIALARRDQVIAVPTLIKRVPTPFRRLLGDMSDETRVLAGLGLPSSRPVERE